MTKTFLTTCSVNRRFFPIKSIVSEIFPNMCAGFRVFFFILFCGFFYSSENVYSSGLLS